MKVRLLSTAGNSVPVSPGVGDGSKVDRNGRRSGRPHSPPPRFQGFAAMRLLWSTYDICWCVWHHIRISTWTRHTCCRRCPTYTDRRQLTWALGLLKASARGGRTVGRPPAANNDYRQPTHRPTTSVSGLTSSRRRWRHQRGADIVLCLFRLLHLKHLTAFNSSGPAIRDTNLDCMR